MSELKKMWDDIKSEDLDAPREEKNMENILVIEGKSIFDDLSKKLKAKLFFVAGGIVFFVAALFFTTNFYAQLMLAGILLVYGFSGYLLFRERRRIIEDVDFSKNLVNHLETFYHKVKRILRLEERIGLFLYPFSASAGFLIGLELGGVGKTDFFGETNDWLIFGAFIVIATPLSHLLARFMNKMAFGRYLKDLERNIIELKKEI